MYLKLFLSFPINTINAVANFKHKTIMSFWGCDLSIPLDSLYYLQNIELKWKAWLFSLKKYIFKKCNSQPKKTVEKNQ